MAEYIAGTHLGTKRVYPINPDSLEYNTAYKGNEFFGNAIVFTDAVRVSINGTESIEAPAGGALYIADNYYYQFGKETLVSQAILQVPNLGVSESTVSTADIDLLKNVETIIVTHNMSAGFGSISGGKGTMEFSVTLTNTENQDAKADIRVYDDGVMVGEDKDFKVPKAGGGTDGIANYFTSVNIIVTVDAESVITATVDTDKVGVAYAGATLLLRKET